MEKSPIRTISRVTIKINIMKVDNKVYKDFEIEVIYCKEARCFSAYSKVGKSHNEYDSSLRNICHGYETPDEAIEDVKKQIDTFLNKTTTSYKELAEVLSNTLTWTSYEECHLDVQILETCLKRFNLKK